MVMALLCLSLALNFILALTSLAMICGVFYLHKKSQSLVESRFLENEKSIQYLVKSVQSFDVANLLASSLYGYSSGAPSKNNSTKSTKMSPILSVIKEKSTSSKQEASSKTEEPNPSI